MKPSHRIWLLLAVMFDKSCDEMIRDGGLTTYDEAMDCEYAQADEMWPE